MYFCARLLAPGSYPYTETYEFNIPEGKLLKIIKNFKNDHQELMVPIDLEDGRKDSSDYWYHIYFYDKATDNIFYTWTRPSEKNKTTFALVAINNGLSLGNWKEINKDFSSNENKKIKEYFKRIILDSIKMRITKLN
ncbi:MAG: hypothetical protein DI598_14605 [Pseudopedobacter saltans]|uniref:Uncharacterized protein n=1 Tax=Pseudopedobacter saltans TaxID=151895 RepID=A0A2W5EJT6_9SPHI|nr:MAG: hypothetical protein DI598_14605 [Pseudopedobacter saltans]